MIEETSATATRPDRAGESMGRQTDLFAEARAACAKRDTLFSGHGRLVRTRQLLATGQWKGPKDAAWAFVAGVDRAAVGGLKAAHDAGARFVVGALDLESSRQAAELGMGVVWQVALPAPQGREFDKHLEAIRRAQGEGVDVRAVLPALEPVVPPVTPAAAPRLPGESLQSNADSPKGLETVSAFSAYRLALDKVHLAADFERLGPRLAQMALAFGADLLWGPLVAERALRVANTASSQALTRQEAANLLRGANLVPHEQLRGDRVEAYGS